ncbi:TPA: hypothetical protein ACH3X1_006830 [Trebouxia sp. C0004]
MTPEPNESTFLKGPVVAVRQSVLHATNHVFGMMEWVASRGPSSLPFSFWKASSADQLQLNQEYVCVEVNLLSGAAVQLRVECNQQLISVSELVSLQTGLSPERQMFVVSENKRRFRGYSAAARDLAHSWTIRRSTKSLVIGMVNFVFLPEVVSREFSGRGVYQWARGGLKQRLKDLHRPQGIVTLQVETLSGLVLALDMSAESSLRDMQALVQQEAGVLLDRQRITIEERLPPSRLLQVANQLVLGSLAGVRAAGQVAFWAHASLKRQLWDKRRFPLQVKTLSGQAVVVDATMDMTLSQVYQALASSTVAAPTQPHSPAQIQEIVLPPVKSVVTVKRSMFTGLQKNIVN